MTVSSPARGRPPRHTRDEIAAAAVQLADAEGLAAVTMRAVATRLATGAMSLYRYVPDKQALVHAMVDLITREQRFPEPSGDWRTDVHLLAHAQRAMFLRHPWALDAVDHRQPIGEGLLASFEFGLAALEPLDLDARGRMETLALITGSVINLVRAQLQARSEESGADPEHRATQQAEMIRLLGTGRFPRFAALLATGAPPTGPAPDLTADFDRLLDRFLDGLIRS